MRDILISEYQDYLIKLQKTIFKILPLYEEKNIFLSKYVNDTYQKVDKVLEIIEPLPHAAWYFDTKSILLIVKDEIVKLDNKLLVKSKVLEMTSLIQKQIDEISSTSIEESEV